jgi:hypothetical protein
LCSLALSAAIIEVDAPHRYAAASVELAHRETAVPFRFIVSSFVKIELMVEKQEAYTLAAEHHDAGRILQNSLTHRRRGWNRRPGDETPHII